MIVFFIERDNNSVMSPDFVTYVSLPLTVSRVREDDIYRGLRGEIYRRSNRAILHALGVHTCSSIDATEIGKTFPAWLKHRLWQYGRGQFTRRFHRVHRGVMAKECEPRKKEKKRSAVRSPGKMDFISRGDFL